MWPSARRISSRRQNSTGRVHRGAVMLEEEVFDSDCMPHLGAVRVLHHWWRSGWTDPFDWQALRHHEPLIMIVLAFGLGVLVSPGT